MRDGTGPNGQGPMTGRGMGPCGRGMGYGRGMGRGMGMGYGCNGCPYYGFVGRMTKEDEKEYLEDEKAALQKEMEAVDERIQDLNK